MRNQTFLHTVYAATLAENSEESSRCFAFFKIVCFCHTSRPSGKH